MSRRRLLSDLKELIAAWKKYPVMAEQIKGVEAAIGYVETIPFVQHERKKGKWIPCSERLPEIDEYVLATTAWGSLTISKRIYLPISNVFCWNIYSHVIAPIDDIVAWKPLPEPYQENQNDFDNRRIDS